MNTVLVNSTAQPLNFDDCDPKPEPKPEPKPKPDECCEKVYHIELHFH